MRSKASLANRLQCVLLLLVVARTAAATGIIYVDTNAPGANNGTSWEDAYVFLQDALAEAEIAEKPVEIRVAQGIYTPGQGFMGARAQYRAHFRLINEVAIKGGFAGFSEADPNARDIELYKTILSGDLEGNDADINNPSDMGGDPTRADNCRNVVVCSNTDATAVLDGLTITGGYSTTFLIEGLAGGAGMIINSGSPTLINCVFTGNFANQAGGGLRNSGGSPTLINCTFSKNQCGRGGGIINYNEASPILINCIFHNNTSNSYGAGMYNHNCSPRLTNCQFSENSANYGGGIYNVRSNMILHNCVFTKNSALTSGGGICNSTSSEFTFVNCTFFRNSAGQGNALACDSWQQNTSIIEITNCILRGGSDEIWNNDSSIFDITYSNVQGGWPGIGNIDAEPLFVNPDNGDYHLKSQAGRWDPIAESWVFDDVTSPCIDAGDPNSPVAFEPFPNGGTVNMGAYGGTPEASKSPSGIHAKYGGGTGEPNNPYLIYTHEQMNIIGQHEQDCDKHFKLMSDIDLDPNLPDRKVFDEAVIGNFKGVFDGNGHTISNFSYISSNGPFVGFFRRISGQNAQIKDLGLIAPEINAETGSHVGSLVGMLSSGTISNCYAEGGSVSGEELVGGLVGLNHGKINNCYSTCSVTGKDDVGGLVGLNSSTTITNCHAGGEVFGRDNVGGLVGWNSGGTIKNSSATGSVTGEKRNINGRENRGIGGLIGDNSGPLIGCSAASDVSGDTQVGGLVGKNSDSIINCYATGCVTGAEYVGGLVGYNSISIINCYSTGGVSGTTYFGGLVGQKGFGGTVLNSFWDIQTSGQLISDGGISRSTVEMQTADTFLFVGWDFVDETENGTEDIWWILEGQDYPRLWWELILEK
jgi:predicted outer membrane repeat protein